MTCRCAGEVECHSRNGAAEEVEEDATEESCCRLGEVVDIDYSRRGCKDHRMGMESHDNQDSAENFDDGTEDVSVVVEEARMEDFPRVDLQKEALQKEALQEEAWPQLWATMAARNAEEEVSLTETPYEHLPSISSSPSVPHVADPLHNSLRRALK